MFQKSKIISHVLKHRDLQDDIEDVATEPKLHTTVYTHGKNPL